MALDELHARRFTTVVTMVEEALDRIALILRAMEEDNETAPASSRLSSDQGRLAREKIEGIRQRLAQAMERFSIERRKAEPRQLLAAELSALWVILENAMPRRMKGYGREFDSADKADWENLIRGLLDGIEHIRKIVLAKVARGEPSEPPPHEHR